MILTHIVPTYRLHRHAELSAGSAASTWRKDRAAARRTKIFGGVDAGMISVWSAAVMTLTVTGGAILGNSVVLGPGSERRKGRGRCGWAAPTAT